MINVHSKVIMGWHWIPSFCMIFTRNLKPITESLSWPKHRHYIENGFHLDHEFLWILRTEIWDMAFFPLDIFWSFTLKIRLSAKDMKDFFFSQDHIMNTPHTTIKGRNTLHYIFPAFSSKIFAPCPVRIVFGLEEWWPGITLSHISPSGCASVPGSGPRLSAHRQPGQTRESSSQSSSGHARERTWPVLSCGHCQVYWSCKKWRWINGPLMRHATSMNR